MATQIKLRRDTAVNWSTANPTLGQGEPGYDLTSRRLKIGDGVSNWNTLDWFDDQVTDLSAYAGSIIPSDDNTYDLGSPAKQWRHGYFANGSLYIGDIKLTNNAGQLTVQQVSDPGLDTEQPLPDTPGVVTTDRIVNGDNSFVINPNGTLSLNGSPFTGSGGGADVGLFKFAGSTLGTVNNPDTGGWGGYDMILTPNGEGNGWVAIPNNDNVVNNNSPTEIGNWGDGGIRLVTSRGGLTIGGNIEAPGDSTHFHIAFDQSNLIPPSAHLFLGDDFNYFKINSGRAGTTIGANDTNGTGQFLWNFTNSGSAQFPGSLEFQSSGAIFQNASFTKTAYPNITNSSSVVWTSSFSYITSAKLTIQVETHEIGDNTGWHTQTCEATISGRIIGGEPVMTVYANTYTSTQPLATFTVRRNQFGFIEVIGTTTSIVDPINIPALRIHSVELMTRD